ncbi:uncharacterized protein LOC130990030 [Salvia miltiorrhiza]|uniref:uncharacterized protein LOC130990030 n=1 Tax=Salvia miltiorrhiza TaxID=226208 RepID=UPI0025ACB2E7|nr:uncharacterized protein LOC130990030 [Salvia miltiorrhiza]
MDETTNFPHHEEKKAAPAAEEEAETSPATPSKIQDKRRSSSEPSEFFEFLHDFSSEMINAEDIIFRGRLVPYRNPQILKSLSADDATRFSRRRRRSPPPAATRPLIARPDIHRSSSKSSEGPKPPRPRWFVMMFGPIKLRPEMDLRDIKSRQVRRNPGRLFEGGGRSDRRSFWGVDLLKVLSCKNHASVAVTASIGLVPHF